MLALLNAKSKKYKMRYLGVKHYKYLQNLLQFLKHIIVSKEIWGLI